MTDGRVPPRRYVCSAAARLEPAWAGLVTFWTVARAAQGLGCSGLSGSLEKFTRAIYAQADRPIMFDDASKC